MAIEGCSSVPNSIEHLHPNGSSQYRRTKKLRIKGYFEKCEFLIESLKLFVAKFIERYFEKVKIISFVN